MISLADFGLRVDWPITLMLFIPDCVLSNIFDTGIDRLLTKFIYSAYYACLYLILVRKSENELNVAI